jgi:hypothetical protein
MQPKEEATDSDSGGGRIIDRKLLSTGFLAEGHLGDDKLKRTLTTLPYHIIGKCIDSRVHGEGSDLTDSISFFDRKLDWTDSFPSSLIVTFQATVVFLSGLHLEPGKICRLRLDDFARKERKRMHKYSKTRFSSLQGLHP